jgi:hypothetical protein
MFPVLGRRQLLVLQVRRLEEEMLGLALLHLEPEPFSVSCGREGRR